MGLNEDLETIKKVAGASGTKHVELPPIIQHTPKGPNNGLITHDGNLADCKSCNPPHTAERRESFDPARISYYGSGTGVWRDAACLACSWDNCVGHALHVDNNTYREALARGLLTMSKAFKADSGVATIAEGWERRVRDVLADGTFHWPAIPPQNYDFKIGEGVFDMESRKFALGEPHECVFPDHVQEVGCRWQCDCGNEWMLISVGTGLRWKHTTTGIEMVTEKQLIGTGQTPAARMCLSCHGLASHDKGCPNAGESLGIKYNAVEPPHYARGPVIKGDIGSQITKGNGGWTHVVQCIEVMRHIRDPRLATAFKYIWRVAFGGKADPSYTGTQEEVDARDIKSAVWYLQDYLDNPPQA